MLDAEVTSTPMCSDLCSHQHTQAGLLQLAFPRCCRAGPRCTVLSRHGFTWLCASTATSPIWVSRDCLRSSSFWFAPDHSGWLTGRSVSSFRIMTGSPSSDLWSPGVCSDDFLDSEEAEELMAPETPAPRVSAGTPVGGLLNRALRRPQYQRGCRPSAPAVDGPYHEGADPLLRQMKRTRAPTLWPHLLTEVRGADHRSPTEVLACSGPARSEASTQALLRLNLPLSLIRSVSALLSWLPPRILRPVSPAFCA